MARKPSKAQLQAELEQTSQSMSDRLQALRDDAQDTGETAVEQLKAKLEALKAQALELRDQARRTLRAHPTYSVGGALAAGLAVGFLLTKSKRQRYAARYERLVGEYIDALRAEALDRIEEGATADAAFTEALRNKVPLVIYEARGGGASDGDDGGFGFWAGVFGLANVLLRPVVRSVARDLANEFTKDLDLKQQLGLDDVLARFLGDDASAQTTEPGGPDLSPGARDTA